MGLAVALMSPLLAKVSLAEGSSPFDGPAAHAAAPSYARQMMALISPTPVRGYVATEGSSPFDGPAAHAAAPNDQDSSFLFGWAGSLGRGGVLEQVGATGGGGQHG
jgi:hypothetical protein